jgi:hypothetical protein
VQLAEPGGALAVGHAELAEADAARLEAEADLGRGRVAARLDTKAAQHVAAYDLDGAVGVAQARAEQHPDEEVHAAVGGDAQGAVLLAHAPPGHRAVPVALERLEEADGVGDVELPVAVDGRDVVAARGRDGARQGSPVAAVARVVHDAEARHGRAHAVEHLARAVGAAVVAEHDLAGVRPSGQDRLPLGDDGGDALGLVEAGRRDRQARRRRRRVGDHAYSARRQAALTASRVAMSAALSATASARALRAACSPVLAPGNGTTPGLASSHASATAAASTPCAAAIAVSASMTGRAAATLSAANHAASARGPAAVCRGRTSR